MFRNSEPPTTRAVVTFRVPCAAFSPVRHTNIYIYISMYVCIYLYHKKRQKRSEERTRNENLFFFLPLRPQRPSGRLSSAVGLLLLGAFLFGLHLVFMLSLSLSRFFLFIFFSLPSPRSLPLFVGTSSGSHTATTGTKTQSARASPRNVHAEFSLLFVLLFFLTSFVLDSFSSPIGSN